MMEVDTRYLLTLREVAKWQSFTRAAEELGYAQSSVTMQVQNLEQEFGVPLFERWGRRIRLTQEGERVLTFAEQVLALVEEAKTSVRGDTLPAGTISVGTVESLAAFFLPPILQKYRLEHPKIKILLKPGVCSDLRQGVRDGVFDFAVIMDWPQSHHDLVCLNLGEVQMVVVASPDHWLVKKERVATEDFCGETLIVTEAGCSYRSMMEGALREAGVSPASSLEFGSLEAIKRCVECDLGLALLPKLTVQEEVASGKLAILKYSHPDIQVYKQLVYHKKKWTPQYLRHLMELIAQRELPDDGKSADGQEK